MAAIVQGPRGDAAFGRTVHTLKGIAALEGIDSIAEHCHALEGALSDGDTHAAMHRAHDIAARWDLVTGKLSPLIEAASSRLELVPADLERIEAAVRRGASADELLGLVDSWRYERIEARLSRFADDAHVLASRLGKGPIDVVVEVDDDLRLPAERWGTFWTAFVHAIRNAIDHGIETPDERRTAGKIGLARLTLRARRQARELSIEIEDTGRGAALVGRLDAVIDRVADRVDERGPERAPALGRQP